MANPHKGAVALETSDGIRSLRFSTNSICELEDHFGGKPIMEIVSELEDESRVSMKMVRAVIWGALIADWPEASLEDAGNILDEVGIDVMTGKLGEALRRFFPEAQEGGNPPEAPAGK